MPRKKKITWHPVHQMRNWSSLVFPNCRLLFTLLFRPLASVTLIGNLSCNEVKLNSNSLTVLIQEKTSAFLRKKNFRPHSMLSERKYWPEENLSDSVLVGNMVDEGDSQRGKVGRVALPEACCKKYVSYVAIALSITCYILSKLHCPRLTAANPG